VFGCGRALGLDDLTFDRDASGIECASHADCAASNFGTTMCRSSRCVALGNYDPTQTDPEQRGDCKLVIGATNLDRGAEPFLFGAFANIDPVAPESSVAVLNYKLAVKEVATLGGIPIAGESRLPVGVVCDARVSPERLERSLDYLVDGLGISSLIAGIGDAAALRSSFEHVQHEQKDVFFLSPLSSSSVLTSIPDGDLLWSMMPDVLDVAPVYLPLVSRIEQFINRAQEEGPGPHLRVALVVASDYTKLSQIGLFLDEQLSFNGKSAAENAPDDYLLLNVSSEYVDPNADLSAQLALLQAFRPHLIVSAAGPEMLTKLIPFLELEWPVAEQQRPFYLLSPLQASDRAQLIATARANAGFQLEQRLVGVNIAAAADSRLYADYFNRLKSEYPEALNIDGTENYYDAAYFLMYAAAAGAKAAQVSGEDMVAGMHRLLGGVSYDVGSRDLLAALGYLRDDPARTIALQGTLGPPDFDENGARRGTGSVWCLERSTDPSSSAPVWNLAWDVLRYDPTAGALSGTFPCFDGF
jgi:hypothetical protein